MVYQRYYRHPIEDKVVHWVPSRKDNSESFVTPLRLQALLHRLSAGQSLPDIKADLPEIPTRSLIHARAYFASQYPDLYKPHYPEQFKVLVDENLDPHFATDGARRAFGHAAHVSFESLDTETDLEVWKYACAENFNMIVTKDRASVQGRKHLDLTRCAELKWKWGLQVHHGNINTRIRQLPRIVHIMDASLEGRNVSSLLVEHRQSIAEIYEEAVSPIIELSKKSAKSGKDYLEILYGRIDPKLERRISFHTAEILSSFELEHLPADERKRVRKSVRNMVKLEMGGDFAKIPYSGNKRARVLGEIQEEVLGGGIVMPEPVNRSGFRAYLAAEKRLVAA